LRLAINRLGETGDWSLEALKIELEELILADALIEISGFTFDASVNARSVAPQRSEVRIPSAPSGRLRER
jgi:hypothetical protein